MKFVAGDLSSRCVLQTLAVQIAAMQLTVEVFSASFRTTLNTDIPIRGVYTTQVGYQYISPFSSCVNI